MYGFNCGHAIIHPDAVHSVYSQYKEIDSKSTEENFNNKYIINGSYFLFWNVKTFTYHLHKSYL